MWRLCSVVSALALWAGCVGASSRLDVIELPMGFYPEGITNGEEWTAYVGSLVNGSIWKGDLSTGEGEVVVSDAGGPAVGLDHDRRSGYLFVCGGTAGTTRVYDEHFDLVADIALAGDDQPSFVNDVIITKTAAYFTNSLQPQIYMVALDAETGELADGANTAATTIDLSGFEVLADSFNANGIVETDDDGTLIVANGSTGLLYKVDAATGVATAMDLGGVTVNGDGLLIRKNTLWAIENRNNYISEVSLSPNATCGSVAPRVLTNPLFDSPTTAMRKGNSLYAVSAKFSTPEEDIPATSYQIVRVDRDEGVYACDATSV
ncbi:unnamed protein product [Scytosiphon promiscuus]